MMVGGEFVADDERALAPGRELGVEVVGSALGPYGETTV
jgi:hypothetical protein